MRRWIATVIFSAVANLCHAVQSHLQCMTLPDSGKVFTFAVDIDRGNKQIFVDGQYTTDVFISDFIVSFVLADENSGYSMALYASGRLVATNQKDHSTLVMQCK